MGRVRLWMLVGAASVVVAAAVCGGCGSSVSSSSGTTGGEATSKDQPGPTVTVPPGPRPKKLVVKELKEGSGRTAADGDAVTVEYVGINWRGEAYSNSWVYQEPPIFVLGYTELIRGFDRGIRGMKPGGKRELLVPTRLTNVPGVRVSPRAIPLVFIVNMVKVVPSKQGQ